MAEQKSVKGSCLCGAVTIRVDLPSKWCAHCHCSMCRKAHGAGYVTWVGFENARFHVTSGESQLAWFQSSELAQRGFCRTCGSSMLFRSERWPGEMHVALGILDGAIDRGPQAHVFHDTHVNWVPLDDALAIFKVN